MGLGPATACARKARATSNCCTSADVMTIVKKWIAALKKQWVAERTRCQSCGMPLIYDKKHQPGRIYCSHCHDGQSFLQDMGLADMRARIHGLLLSRKASAPMRLYMYWRLATLRRWRRSRESE